MSHETPSREASAIAFIVTSIRPTWLRADVETVTQERLTRTGDLAATAAAAIDAASNPALLLPAVIRTHQPTAPRPQTLVNHPPKAERCPTCGQIICACSVPPLDVGQAVIDQMKATFLNRRKANR